MQLFIYKFYAERTKKKENFQFAFVIFSSFKKLSKNILQK